MPNIKSACKRVQVNQKKSAENRAVRSSMNSAIKKFNALLETNKVDEAEKLLPATMSIIDSTASKGIIHKNNAANKKSALAKRLSDVKSGKSVIVIKKDNKTLAAEKAKAAQEVRASAKAEFERKANEKKLAKIEAEKAKLEAEKAAKKKPKKEDKPEKVAKEKKSASKNDEDAPAKKTKAKKAEANNDDEPKA